MKKLILYIFFFVFLILSADINAQCSVCRLGAESHIDHRENERGRGLNKGILYLMSVPYLMGGIAGVIWWRNKKKN